MRTRKLIIQDRNFAAAILSSVPYYRLINGYKSAFTHQVGQYEYFKKGISIELLYTFYDFDETLKSILFKYIIQIETTLKNQVCYLISENYGVHQDHYLLDANYRASPIANDLLQYLKQELNSTEQPIKFYREGDLNNNKPAKNHIPAWILASNLSFYDTIRWYQILFNFDQKKIIDYFFNFDNDWTLPEKQNVFYNSLNLIRKYRNKCAHGAPAIHYKIDQYKLPKNIINELSPGLISKKNGVNDYKAVLIAITLLHDNPDQLAKMFIELKALYNTYHSDFLKYPYHISRVRIDTIDELANIAHILYD